MRTSTNTAGLKTVTTSFAPDSASTVQLTPSYKLPLALVIAAFSAAGANLGRSYCWHYLAYFSLAATLRLQSLKAP